MDRRTFMRLTGGVAAFGAGLTVAERDRIFAQETPFADLGLPELAVTLTEDGFAVSPEEVAEGWALVTFTNELTTDNFNRADLLLLPADVSIEDIMARVANGDPGPAPWAYETTWAGGPVALGGITTHAVVNFIPGDWLVWSAGEPHQGAALTVTEADTTASTLSITADLEVRVDEYAFNGLEKPLAAGAQVWKVSNTGKQPHHMQLFAVPDGTTTAQLLDGWTGMMTGTPVPGAMDMAAMRPVGGMGALSIDQTAWLEFDLEVGTYAALCFVADREQHLPHLTLGMGDGLCG